MKKAGDATSGMVQEKLDKALDELTTLRERFRVSQVNKTSAIFGATAPFDIPMKL